MPVRLANGQVAIYPKTKCQLGLKPQLGGLGQCLTTETTTYLTGYWLLR